MVQIFSQNYDASTQDIIDWLAYNNQSFYRINGRDWYNKSRVYFEIGKSSSDTAGAGVSFE